MSKNIFKSIWAIAAGFATVFILSVITDVVLETTHIFPPQAHPEAYTWMMLFFALIYRCAYTVLGGYVVAKLAPNTPMKHAIILATIGFAFSLLGTIAMWDKSSHWYPILLTILSPISLLLGARLKTK